MGGIKQNHLHMHESLSPGYRSIVIFQNAFVNLAVVVVQVCAQNSRDKLGSVCCEKTECI
jgi:hypothetical protein